MQTMSANELQHHTLPPRYVEIFEITCDMFKEINHKCINNIIKYSLNLNTI